MCASPRGAQPSVEAFNEGVLCRLTRRDIVPIDFAFVGEGQDRIRGELGAVIADDHHGFSALFDDRRQFPRHPGTGQQCVGNERQAFAGAVVDHDQRPEPPPIRCPAVDCKQSTRGGQLIRHKIQRPLLIWRHCHQHWRPCPDGPFRGTPAADMQLLLAIHPEHALVPSRACKHALPGNN